MCMEAFPCILPPPTTIIINIIIVIVVVIYIYRTAITGSRWTKAFPSDLYTSPSDVYALQPAASYF